MTKSYGILGHNPGTKRLILVVIRIWIWIRIRECFWRNFTIAILDCFDCYVVAICLF